MLQELQSYPVYKPSRLPWLGTIPAHWEDQRGKYLFREVDERSTTGEEELLSVSHITGVTPRRQKNVAMFKAESYVGSKLCRSGDLVVNTMWAWMAALGVAREKGIVSPSYHVYRPAVRNALAPDFVDYLLRTQPYVSEYICRSTGIRSSRLRLYPEEFLDIRILCPPPDEQASIVRFLDWANGRLERAIRAKKKQLALVSELLLTATQHALGLQGSKSLRVSTVAEVMSRPINRHAGQSYTPIGLYNRGRGIFQKATTVGAELGDSDFFWVRDGDLVISGQFAWEGSVALARVKDSGCVASHRYPILRGREEYASSAVLLALFRTSYGSMLLDLHSRGAAGRNRPLNLGMLLKEKIPIPPLSAQIRIIELLDQEYTVAQLLAQTTRFINEYRTRLIADVVTGKLDVRGAEIPDEPGRADERDAIEEDEDDAGLTEDWLPEDDDE